MGPACAGRLKDGRDSLARSVVRYTQVIQQNSELWRQGYAECLAHWANQPREAIQKAVYTELRPLGNIEGGRGWNAALEMLKGKYGRTG